MTRSSQIAALLSFAAVFITYWVSEQAYERLPHLEDEIAYVWQAQVLAKGEIAIPSPPHAESFYVPFVVDYHGLRFSKYPPGWPMILALGMVIGVSAWVNPILAGLNLWLTFRLGQRIFDERTALLAAFLMLTSPFFLLVSGSLLSHSWSLFLCLALTSAWLDLFIRHGDLSNPATQAQNPKHTVHVLIKVFVAGLCMGALALTRPLTAVAVGLPFLIHGLTLLYLADWNIRRKVLTIGFITAAVSAILPVWQFELTGDPFINLYTLWYPYDKLGFGSDIGTQSTGHNLFWSLNNFVLSAVAGSRDLFGWAGLSWLFIPVGLWAARRKASIKLLVGVSFGLVLAYTIYWISPNRFGPRYYYESIFCLCLLTAAGIAWCMDASNRATASGTLRTGLLLLVIALIGYNLFVYIPGRFETMRDVYGISRAQQAPFLTPEIQKLAPVLVIVHTENWSDYAGLLPLEDPWLTSPFIFAHQPDRMVDTIDPQDFPDRKIVHYYPDTMEVTLAPK
jgi:4-amino-4-deoxy-L-arabinose transferase-like glycosyltransferase